MSWSDDKDLSSKTDGIGWKLSQKKIKLRKDKYEIMAYVHKFVKKLDWFEVKDELW